MNIHRTFPAFTTPTAAECRLIFQTVENPGPPEPVAKLDAVPPLTSDGVNKEATAAAHTRIDATTKGLFGRAAETKAGFLKDQAQQNQKLNQPQQFNGNIEAEQKILNSEAFQKRNKAFNTMLRSRGMGMTEEEAQSAQDSIDSLPASVRNVVYTIAPILKMLGIIGKSNQAGSPTYRPPDAPAGTPAERLIAQQKMTAATDKSMQEVQKSTQYVPVGLTGVVIPTSVNQGLVKTAQQNVQLELKAVNELVGLPEAQRKGLGDAANKQLGVRQQELQKMVKELEGLAKLLPSPEAVKKEGEAKAKGGTAPEAIAKDLEGKTKASEVRGKGQEEILKSTAQAIFKSIDSLVQEIERAGKMNPEMLGAMTPEQSQSVETLAKQLPAVMKIINQQANGAPISVNDRRVLLQAFVDSSRITGPLQQSIQKTMKQLSELITQNG